MIHWIKSPYAATGGKHPGGKHRKAKGKGKKGEGMRDTAADSIIPGPGLVCEERVAWVNALTIDLRKLQRKDKGYLYCLWVGFPASYYEKAAAKRELDFSVQLFLLYATCF